MPVERFFKDVPLEENETISLEEEELHHLSHVLRLKKGEEIEIVNGKGSLAKGSIESIEKKQAFILITQVEKSSPPSYSLILAQGIPRLSRLEYILEKSVELGVTEIWLLQAMLSEKKTFSPSQMKRMHYIITSALKQSGRLYLPKLIIKELKDLPEYSFFGDTKEGKPPLFKEIKKGENTLIAIGPEKGFHKKEIEKMENLGMKGVSLHTNILRTDTAAIASLAIASALLIDC